MRYKSTWATHSSNSESRPSTLRLHAVPVVNVWRLLALPLPLGLQECSTTELVRNGLRRALQPGSHPKPRREAYHPCGGFRTGGRHALEAFSQFPCVCSIFLPGACGHSFSCPCVQDLEFLILGQGSIRCVPATLKPEPTSACRRVSEGACYLEVPGCISEMCP